MKVTSIDLHHLLYRLRYNSNLCHHKRSQNFRRVWLLLDHLLMMNNNAKMVIEQPTNVFKVAAAGDSALDAVGPNENNITMNVAGVTSPRSEDDFPLRFGFFVRTLSKSGPDSPIVIILPGLAF